MEEKGLKAFASLAPLASFRNAGIFLTEIANTVDI
jgi:hypothetical protein